MVRARDPFDFRDWRTIDGALMRFVSLWLWPSKYLANGKGSEFHTFLFRRVYRCEKGSHQIISPVEKPIITSMCDELLVSSLTS